MIILPLCLLGMGGENFVPVDWNGDFYPDQVIWTKNTVKLNLNYNGDLQYAGILRQYQNKTIADIQVKTIDQNLMVRFTDGSEDIITKNTPALAGRSLERIHPYDPPPNTVDFNLMFSSPPGWYSFRFYGMDDLDGDGADEVMACDVIPGQPGNWATMRIWKTTGDNQLAIFDTLDGAAVYATESVSRADIYNDGNIWTVSSFISTSNSDGMILKIQDGHLIHHDLWSPGNPPYSRDFSDLNQNGITDLLVNYVDSDRSNAIYLSEFDNTSLDQSVYYSAYSSIDIHGAVSDIRTGDIDADGEQEIVLGSRGNLYWADTTYIYYYDKLPDNTFVRRSIPLPYAFNPAYVGVCDSDHDGVDEILALGPLLITTDPWQVVFTVMLVGKVGNQFQVMAIDTTSMPYPVGSFHQVILKEYNGIYYFLIPTTWPVTTGHKASALYLFKIQDAQISHLWHSPVLDSVQTWSGGLGDTDGDGLLEASIVYAQGWQGDSPPQPSHWLIYETPDIQTGIQPEPNPIKPEGFSVGNPYPNPFNPSVTIRYTIPENSLVSIIIYDQLGRQVNTLVNTQQTIGNYELQWNRTDHSGRPLASGLYFCRVQAGQLSQSVKLVLLR